MNHDQCPVSKHDFSILLLKLREHGLGPYKTCIKLAIVLLMLIKEQEMRNAS